MSELDKFLVDARKQVASRTSLKLASDPTAPDVAAENQRLSQELNLPPVVVSSDPEGYKQQAQTRNIQKQLADAPKLSQWLADSQNGAVAKDDIENLSWFERWERARDRTGRGGSPLVEGMKRGGTRLTAAVPYMGAVTSATRALDVGKSLDDLIAEELEKVGGEKAPAAMRVNALQSAQLRYDAIAGQGEAERLQYIKQGGEALAKAHSIVEKSQAIEMSDEAKQFRDTTLAHSPNTVAGTFGAFIADPVGGAAFIAETAAEFLPVMAIGAAASMATGSAATGGLVMGAGSFSLESSVSALDFLDEMKVDISTPEAAARVLQDTSLMAAAKKRGVERGLIIAAFDAVSGGIAGQALAKSPWADLVVQSLAQAAMGSAGEAAAQYQTTGEIDARDVVIEGLAETAMVPIEVVGVGNRAFGKKASELGIAGFTAAELDEIDKKVAESKLKPRSPEKFKEAMEELVEGDVFIDADQLREYFQSKDMELDDETLRAWGIDPEDFKVQEAAAAAVAIPKSAYASMISGTEDAEWFKANAKSEPTGMSKADMFNEITHEELRKAFQKDQDALRADMESRASSQQIYDSIYSQIRAANAAGSSPAAADLLSLQWTAFFTSAADRMNEDVFDLARMFGVEVRGPAAAEPTRKRGTLDVQLNLLRSRGEKALKPKGEGLIDFIKREGGIRDRGGDVEAMEPPKGVIAETRAEIEARRAQPILEGMPSRGLGVEIDEMARKVVEAGYFPDLMGEVAGMNEDQAVDAAARLLEALSEAAAGRDVYREGEGMDADLQALSEAVSSLGIDLSTATNDEVFVALETAAADADGVTYDQITPNLVFGKADGNEIVFENSMDVSSELAGFVKDMLPKTPFIEAKVGSSNVSVSTYVNVDFLELDSDGDPVADFGGFKLRFSDHRDRYGSDKTIRFEGAVNFVEEDGEYVETRISKQDFLSLISDGIDSIRDAFEEQASGVLEQGDIDAVLALFEPVQAKIFEQSAFHGTRHKFDRFSLDAIGTGEGAQAYGWGLYFAGKRAIAEFYRDVLTPQDNVVTPEGMTAGRFDTMALAEMVADYSDQVPENEVDGAMDEVVAYLRELTNDITPRPFINKYSAGIVDRMKADGWTITEPTYGFLAGPDGVKYDFFGDDPATNYDAWKQAVLSDLQTLGFGDGASPNGTYSVIDAFQIYADMESTISLARFADQEVTGRGAKKARAKGFFSDDITEDEAREVREELEDREWVAGALKALDKEGWKPGKKTPGQLYEVDIPDDNELLDYDVPVSQMPKEVQKKLRSIPALRPWMEWAEAHRKWIESPGKDGDRALMNKAKKLAYEHGIDAIRGRDRGVDLYRWLAKKALSAKAIVPEKYEDENIILKEEDGDLDTFLNDMMERNGIDWDDTDWGGVFGMYFSNVFYEEDGWPIQVAIDTFNEAAERWLDTSRWDKGQLARWYVANIGYDPFKDDPDTTIEEVRKTVQDYIRKTFATGDRQASHLLNEAGIPGLRYLDNTARSLGRKQSYNYVIWDENRVDVRAVNDQLIEAEEQAGERPITETRPFKEWFGDSKVVDENGNPKVVYHGTVADIDSFTRDSRGTSTGTVAAQKAAWFTDNPDVASGYADLARRKRSFGRATGFWSERDDRNVVPVYLSIQNPLIVEEGMPDQPFSMADAIDRAKAAGHDGVIYKRSKDIPFAAVPTLDGEQLSIDHRSMFAEETFPAYLEGTMTAEEVLQEMDEAIVSINQELDAALQSDDFDQEEVNIWQFDLAEWMRMRDAWADDPSRFDEGIPQQDVYAVIEPSQIKSVFNRGTFDAADPRIMYQSTELRAGIEDLSEYGIEPGKIYKTREIAAALEARTRDRHGTIDGNDRSVEALEKLSDWMVDEVEYEYLQSERNGNSAVGWYSTKYQAAIDELSVLFPELRLRANYMEDTVFNSPQEARDYLTALVAITSDGEKVYSNWKRAKELYAQARETGVLPEDTKATRGVSMRANAKIINELYAEHGAGMKDFLLEELLVSDINRELKDKGMSAAQYPASRTMPRAATYFGPKLGAFYANLSGAEGYLTMDRWWSRTINRYRGALLDAATPQGIETVRLLAAADRNGMRLPSPKLKGKKREAALDRLRNRVINRFGEDALNISDDQVLSIATQQAANYGAKGFKNGTILEAASNTIYKAAFENLQDQPLNTSDRGFMIDAVTMAKDKLERVGIETSIADIQAVLWYYEKRLYAEMGARATPDVSYEEVAKRIVEEETQAVHGRRRGSKDVGQNVVRGPDGSEFETEGGQAIGEDTNEVVPPKELFQQPQRNDLGLFSMVEKTVLEMNIPGFKPSKKNPDGRALGTDIIAKLKSSPIKREEYEWLGLEEFLMSGDRFSRDEVVEFIRQNGVNVVEVTSLADSPDEQTIQWSEPEVWDDREGWMLNVPDLVADADFNGITQEAVLSVVGDEVDYIAKHKDPDEETIDYVQREFADEIQKRVNELAEKQAEQAYLDDPYLVVRDPDTELIIFGNDSIGYDIRTNLNDYSSVIHSDIYSLNEAKIQALEMARADGLISSPENVAQWEDYIMPGKAENYRELKLTLPDIKGDFYNRTHFPDRNIVAFLRVDDRTLNYGRTDPEDIELRPAPAGNYWLYDKALNKKLRPFSISKDVAEDMLASAKRIGVAPSLNTYFIDEMQSDWHQDGRQRGYGEVNVESELMERWEAAEKNAVEAGWIVRQEGVVFDTLPWNGSTAPTKEQTDAQVAFERAEYDRRAVVNNPPPPDAPFKGDAWLSLGLKRALVDAVENGYEAIAWPNSEVMSERWSRRYRELYKTQYDKKMPSLIKKLTKQDPVLMNLESQDGLWSMPITEEDMAKPKTFEVRQVGQKWGVFEEGTDTLSSGIFDTEETANIALSGVQEAESHYASGPEGYWIVNITPELRAKIQQEGLPLFQNKPKGPQGPRGSIQFPTRKTDTGETVVDLESGTTVINMFEASNLTTFLHESSHFFLEAYTVLAQMESAPQQMRDDLAAIRKYLGNNGGQYTREQHELWADTGEAYFREGKAPSLELREAFRRFKQWLIQAYRMVKGARIDRVKITPEISDVMDRMLATDDQIKAAREDQSIEPMFTSADQAKMEEEDYKNYEKLVARSTGDAEEKLLNKLMATIRREREAWFKAEKAEVRTEVEGSLNKEPRYRLINMLGNQKWVDNDNEVPDIRIDREMLVEQFGDGILSLISNRQLGGRRNIFTKAGEEGVSPSEVAELFGFVHAGDMIETLKGTGKLNDLIDSEVDRIMKERHGDPLTDGSIEEEAMQAIHGDHQANVVISEIRSLALQLGRDVRGSRAQIYKRRAQEMISRMSVGNATRPAQFLNAERKAATAAQRAYADGNLSEALQAKEQQILNQYLYREAARVEKYVQSGRERMRNYSKKSVRKNLEGGYIEQIDALLEDYDFRVRSKKQVSRAANLRAYIEAMTEAGRANELNIDGRLTDEAYRKHYSKMSVDELRGLFDTIANLDYMGRRKQKLIDAKAERDLNELIDGITAAMDENVKAKPPSRVETSGEKRRKTFRDYLNLTLTAETMLRAIDGFKSFGPAYTAIKAPIDRAMNRLAERRIQMAKDFDNIYSAYTGPEQRAMSKKKYNEALGDSFSKWDLLAIAFNTGNADNWQRLTNTNTKGGFTPEQVDAALAALDERDWRVVQSMWDYVNSFWPEIAAKEKRQTGVEPKKVEGVSMSRAAPDWVTGGYYPISYDSRLSGLITNSDMNEMADQLRSGVFSKAQTKNGHTKERVKSYAQPLQLDLSVVHAHVSQVLYDIELGEAVGNGWRILSNRRLKQTFFDKGMKSDWEALEMWIKDVASGDRVAARGMEKYMRHLRAGFVVSRLAINFSTALIQPSGLAQSMVVVGKKAMTKGMISYMSKPFQWTEDVLAVSPMMREREKTFNRDIYNVVGDLEGGPVSGRWAKFSRDVALPVSFYMMQKVQFYAVDMPTWIAAYEAEIKKSGDETRAREYADQMVKRSQGSGLLSDRGALERGTTALDSRQRELPRMFTALGSYMFAKGNVAYERTMKLKGKKPWSDPIEYISYITDMVLLFTLEAVLYSLVKGYLPDDEEESIPMWLLKETGFSMMSTVPLLREVSGGIQGFGTGGILGATLEKAIVKPIMQSEKIMEWDWDKAAVKAFIDAGGIWMHLPSSQVNRFVEEYLEDDLDMARDPSFLRGTGVGQGDVSPIEFLMNATGN